LIPLHSLALHEDISVDTVTGAVNPSEQNPPLHAWPIGQVLSARHGNFADAPFQRPTYGFDGTNIFVKMKHTNVTTKTRPMPEPSFNMIPSDDVPEN
jgi:hypothetical protein